MPLGRNGRPALSGWSAQVREGLRTYSNWPTYPQLYVDGKLIGGLDIVKELKEEGELNDALGSACPVQLRILWLRTLSLSLFAFPPPPHTHTTTTTTSMSV